LSAATKSRLCYALLHVRDNYNLKSHKNIEQQQQQHSAARFVKRMINIYCFSADIVFILLLFYFHENPYSLIGTVRQVANNQSSSSVSPWAKSNSISPT
jgi:hypothetical protein